MAASGAGDRTNLQSSSSDPEVQAQRSADTSVGRGVSALAGMNLSEMIPRQMKIMYD